MPDPQLQPQAQEPMVPMLAPDGTPGHVPQSQIQEAVKAGGKLGVTMTAPDGSVGVVPMDRVHEAVAAGGQLPGHEDSQMKQFGSRLYRNFIGSTHEAGKQFYAELTANPSKEEANARADASDAHKREIYHKAAADFHKGMADRDAGTMLQSGKDLLELFATDYPGAYPNDVVGNIATAVIRGAEDQYHKAGQHVSNVVNSLFDAAERHAHGDIEGARKVLSEAGAEAVQAGGHGLAAALPVLGPMAANAGEELREGKTGAGLADAATLLGPSALKGLKETGVLAKAGEVASGAAGKYYDVAKAASEKYLPKSVTSPATDLAGKAVGKVGDAAMGAAKYVARKAGQAAPGAAAKVGRTAATLGKEFAGGVVDSLADTANDAFEKIKEPGADAIRTLKEARDAMLQQLTDAKIPTEKAHALVNQISNAVQDKYYELTLPGVGGGSTDAAGAMSFGDQVRQMAVDTIGPRSTGATRASVANKIGAKLGVTYGDEPLEVPSLTEEEKAAPEEPPIQSGKNAGDHRTDFSRAAAQEKAAGNPVNLWTVGTRGQIMGGLIAKMEEGLRRYPILGFDIAKALDQPGLRTAKDAVSAAVKMIQTEEPELGGQALQKLASDVNRSAGKVLGETLEKMKQSHPDAAFDLDRFTRDGLTAMSKEVPLTEPVIKAALDNPNWDTIAEARKVIRGFAADEGQAGYTAVKVGAQLDKAIKQVLEEAKPGAGKEYLAVVKHGNDIAGSLGTGMLRKLVDADSSVAYDRLLEMSTKRINNELSPFEKAMSQLTQGQYERYRPRIEQGMMRRILERDVLPAMGDNPNPGKIGDALFRYKDKFNPATVQRFQTLLEGVKQMAKDARTTATRGTPHWIGTAGHAVVGGVGGLLIGHGVEGAVLGAGAGLGLHFGLEHMAKMLMTPSYAEELSTFWRTLAKVQPTDSEKQYAIQRAKTIHAHMKRVASTLNKDNQ